MKRKRPRKYKPTLEIKDKNGKPVIQIFDSFEALKWDRQKRELSIHEKETQQKHADSLKKIKPIKSKNKGQDH